jgi:hypothetical protein
MEVRPLSRACGVGVGVLRQNARVERRIEFPPPAALRTATSPASGLLYSHILREDLIADSVGCFKIRGRAFDDWHGLRARPVRRHTAGKRGANFHAALVRRPGSCIRQLAQRDRAREVQFTRFLCNGAVTVQEMAASAADRTSARAVGRDVVVAQDTSELSVGGRRAKANGYGPIGKGGALRGLLQHAVLAVDAGTGGVLGLVDTMVWNRKGGQIKHRRSRTIDQKESQRWIDGTRRAAQVLAGAASVTGVSDGESDIYEHFVQCPDNMHLIVRACQNRRIETDDEEEQIDMLFSYVDGCLNKVALRRRFRPRLAARRAPANWPSASRLLSCASQDMARPPCPIRSL